MMLNLKLCVIVTCIQGAFRDSYHWKVRYVQSKQLATAGPGTSVGGPAADEGLDITNWDFLLGQRCGNQGFGRLTTVCIPDCRTFD
jgi:hypothetical protein